MTGFWPKPRRHSLAWLAHPPENPLALDWWRHDRPFVLCRTRPDEQLSLGFCLPNPAGGKPSRHGFAAGWCDLGMLAPPPELPEAASRLSPLAPLLQNSLQPPPRLFGSAMWEALTALPFTNPASDYDLLCEVSAQSPPSRIVEFFRQAAQLLSNRVDGEISFPGIGEVAWREFDSDAPWILVKSLEDGVRLIERDALFQRDCPTALPVPSTVELADAALASLLEEIHLYPKPGLVSCHDSGAHRDMDASLMQRSAHALHSPFSAIAKTPGPFADCLVPMGLLAEQCMLDATGGVNAHRGAIFVIGLLIAAAARSGRSDRPEDIRTSLLRSYGEDLAAHELTNASPSTHGGLARKSTGCGGARSEAARGFPSVFERALPRFRSLLNGGHPRQAAAIETLFVLIASAEDSNLAHRGGADGLALARRLAGAFLAEGGVKTPGWFGRAQAVHREFVRLNLSPGGCADLLAATLFVHRITS